jgi:hypothetical protein
VSGSPVAPHRPGGHTGPEVHRVAHSKETERALLPPWVRGQGGDTTAQHTQKHRCRSNHGSDPLTAPFRGPLSTARRRFRHWLLQGPATKSKRPWDQPRDPDHRTGYGQRQIPPRAGAGSGDAATGRSTQVFTSTVSAPFVSYRERPLRRALAVALVVADGLVTVVVALRRGQFKPANPLKRVQPARLATLSQDPAYLDR